MGRFSKSIFITNGVDRRELGYYSTPEFISKFMVDAMFAINPDGTCALDPCVGKEEMIKDLYEKNIDIDGIDIYDHGDYFYCNYIQDDFIMFYKRCKSNLLFGQKIDLKYDYIIANPPYNCHELDYIRTNRKSLNLLFGSVGTHNMYSMFISAIIDSAKDGALISIITADSFLTTRMHNPLRDQILKECSVHYLILCPTDLFWDQKADVRTCILILQKGPQFQKAVNVLNRPKNKDELQLKLQHRSFIGTELDNIVNASAEGDFEFVVDIPAEVQSLFSHQRIGQTFKCLTGISTGQDAIFISKEKKDGFEMPFYKNPGSRKFYCDPDGYLTNDYLKHDKEIKNFMVRNKSYMLKEGITCSSMGVSFGACYLPQGSTYGVNANIFCNPPDIWWLLSYLNSSLVTYIVRGILCRSNMITSGYVSKIPIIEFDKNTKKRLEKIAKEAYEQRISPKDNRTMINFVDQIIFENLQFSDDIEREIVDFATNLQSRV